MNTCLKYFRICGIISNRLDIPTNDFLRTINSLAFLFGFLGPMITFSATFVYYNSTDVEAITNAMLFFTAGFAGVGSFVSMGVKMNVIKRLYQEIQGVVNRGTNYLPLTVTQIFMRGFPIDYFFVVFYLICSAII